MYMGLNVHGISTYHSGDAGRAHEHELAFRYRDAVLQGPTCMMGNTHDTEHTKREREEGGDVRECSGEDDVGVSSAALTAKSQPSAGDEKDKQAKERLRQENIPLRLWLMRATIAPIFAAPSQQATKMGWFSIT